MRTLYSKWSGQTASRRGANSKRSRPKRDWSWTVIVGLISNSPTSCRRILRASTAIRFRKSAPDGRQSLRRERPDILPRKPGPMIIYSSRFLTRGEVWFDEEPGNIRSLDWILYNLRSSPAPGARWRYFYNYVIDLTQSAEQLHFFSSRRRHTRFDCDWSSDVCSSDLPARRTIRFDFHRGTFRAAEPGSGTPLRWPSFLQMIERPPPRPKVRESSGSDHRAKEDRKSVV